MPTFYSWSPYLQVEGACSLPPPSPFSPGSAPRGNSSYFSLQIFSLRGGPKGQVFQLSLLRGLVNFVWGWGRVEMSSLPPLCAYGTRGADVNLWGWQSGL